MRWWWWGWASFFVVAQLLLPLQVATAMQSAQWRIRAQTKEEAQAQTRAPKQSTQVGPHDACKREEYVQCRLQTTVVCAGVARGLE